MAPMRNHLLVLLLFREKALVEVSKRLVRGPCSSSFRLTPRCMTRVWSRVFLGVLAVPGTGAGADPDAAARAGAGGEAELSVSRRISIWPRRRVWPGFRTPSE